MKRLPTTGSALEKKLKKIKTGLLNLSVRGGFLGVHFSDLSVKVFFD